MRLAIKSVPMKKWDFRFCELAKFVSEWSKDPNAKVGAVVFSKKGGDVSIGYNGFPMGVEDSAERLEDQEIKLEIVVHAELNALSPQGLVLRAPLCMFGESLFVPDVLGQLFRPGLSESSR